MRIGKRWSSNDLIKVKDVYLEGGSIKELAIEIGRSQSAIRRQAHKIGIQYKTFGDDHFSPQEDQFIVDKCRSMTRVEIGTHLGRSEGSISHRGKRLRVQFADESKRAIYSKNKEFFDSPDLTNSYLAGLIATDGWVRPESSEKPINQVGISLSKKDRAILEFIKDATQYEGDIRDYSTKDEHQQSELRINGVPTWLAALSRTWNIGPNKTHTLTPPNTDLLDDEQIAAYLVGAIEGDGSVSMKNGTLMISLVSASLPYIEWIQQIWRGYCGAEGNIYKHKTLNAYYLSLFGQNARLVSHKLMQVGVHRLERKWDVAKSEILKFQDVG